MTTLFFSFNNISLYYDYHNSSSNQGLFQAMPINHTFLIFAFSAIIGIMPSYGMVDKFFVLKNIIKEGNFNSFIILLINFLSIIIIYFKNFKLIFSKTDVEKINQKNDFAEYLESDSSLSITNFISVIILFSGIIVFPILAKFIS
jgi:formate hydrogenlyase subunit 3/multisubunit Na+/H+ antiporter MnhD subunit